MILNSSSCILTIDSRLRGNDGRFCKGLDVGVAVGVGVDAVKVNVM